MTGARVKLVRDANGWTQARLAKAIGASQQGVYSIESGIYNIARPQLDSIARETGFARAFFEKGEPPEFPFGTILYRAQRRVRHAVKTQAHANAQIAFELAQELAARLRAIPLNVRRIDLGDDCLADRAAASAQLIRTHLGLSPDSPIKGLIGTLERNGVIVLSIPTGSDGLDGFSAWAGRNPERPVVVLAAQRGTPYRQRFTVAEELGHLVMHFPLRVPVPEAEREAKAFARELLLPESAMREELAPPVTLSSLAPLKPRWGASIAFLAMRARSLGILSPNQHRHLIGQMRRRWGSRAEPGDEAATWERPLLLEQMAKIAYPGSPIDFHKLAGMSGLSPWYLRRLVTGGEPGTVVPFQQP